VSELPPEPSPVCPHCGAATQAALGRVAAWPDHGIVAVEGIPARLCSVCGEQSWAADVAADLRRLLSSDATSLPGVERMIPLVNVSRQREAAASDRPPPGNAPAVLADGEAAGGAEHAADGDAQVCNYCGAATRPEVVRTVLFAEHGWIAIEGLPARVCVDCGERFYDEQTTWQLANLSHIPDRTGAAPRQIVCRVVAFAANPSAG
jgi:YgiT-type zinc finger domain-containing protein